MSKEMLEYCIKIDKLKEENEKLKKQIKSAGRKLLKIRISRIMQYAKFYLSMLAHLIIGGTVLIIAGLALFTIAHIIGEAWINCLNASGIFQLLDMAEASMLQ